MTAKELEDKAWRLITSAKMAVNDMRRKLLMKEAFELLARASVLRKSEYENEEAETGFSLGEQAYRMRLSNWDGAILWIYLPVESRADSIWAAYALWSACSDCFDDFDLWDGVSHLLGVDDKLSRFFSDSAEEVAVAVSKLS